jgi:hypothetical protein
MYRKDFHSANKKYSFSKLLIMYNCLKLIITQQEWSNFCHVMEEKRSSKKIG